MNNTMTIVTVTTWISDKDTFLCLHSYPYLLCLILTFFHAIPTLWFILWDVFITCSMSEKKKIHILFPDTVLLSLYRYQPLAWNRKAITCTYNGWEGDHIPGRSKRLSRHVLCFFVTYVYAPYMFAVEPVESSQWLWDPTATRGRGTADSLSV